MKTYFLRDPIYSGIHEFNIPDHAIYEFEQFILPGLIEAFNEADEQIKHQATFGAFDWALFAGSLVSTAADWLKGKGGSSSFWSDWGWDAFVQNMKAAGCITDNPKFAYCHHCDGNTYRVHITNAGKVEYSKREKTGSNCRVDCSMLPPKVLAAMPACNGGSSIWKDPGGIDSDKWTKYVLYAGVGVVGLVLVSAIIKKIK